MIPRRSRLLRRLAPVASASLGLVLASCGDAPPETAAADPTATPAAIRLADTPPAPRPTGPLPAGQSCISAGCHATFATAPNVHGVLWPSDNCFVCHEQDTGGHVYPVRTPGSAGCTSCHETVTGTREHRHAATEVGCLACHDPHASSHRALLRLPVDALCRSCHPATRHAVGHPPYAAGECVACHEPHESDFDGLLRGGSGPEHCYLCHEATARALEQAAFVHAPAVEDCGGCHAPHGSGHPHLLAAAIDEQCFACHADIEQLVEGAAAPHGALSLDERCANCHDAHASDRPGLLKARQDELCLRCHDQPVTAFDGRTIPGMAETIREREFLHGPVESGDCTACHLVHGGSHSRLLKQHFEERFYASFDLSHYALCFQCHESDLVTVARTDALTDFRDGDLNLHHLHVNRDRKGRTCRACHELHGSDLPAHVAETVPFEGSGWPLPIGFEKTDTGGSCAPGCHRPMQYDRVQPMGWGDGTAAPGPANGDPP